ncbi:MAG: hypothetical protein V4792_09505 [Pseudomonadota bacterium]
MPAKPLSGHRQGFGAAAFAALRLPCAAPSRGMGAAFVDNLMKGHANIHTWFVAPRHQVQAWPEAPLRTDPRSIPEWALSKSRRLIRRT